MLYGAMNFPVVPVLDEIDTFAQLGFDYLELTMDQPRAHYSIISENQTAITKALEKYGMGIVCHLPTFVSTADLTDSIRRAAVTEMRRSLLVASDLGVEKVVLHPPVISGMGTFVPDIARGHAFEFLSEMVDQSDQLDITICLENMMPRNGFGVEPDEFEIIFKAFPTLQFTLDTGHANLNNKGANRLNDLVKRFGDRINHVHLSDNLGKYDDHFALGKGNIDIYRLVKRLQAIGYDGTITFEVFDDNRLRLTESRELVKEMLAAPGY